MVKMNYFYKRERAYCQVGWIETVHDTPVTSAKPIFTKVIATLRKISVSGSFAWSRSGIDRSLLE